MNKSNHLSVLWIVILCATGTLGYSLNSAFDNPGYGPTWSEDKVTDQLLQSLLMH